MTASSVTLGVGRDLPEVEPSGAAEGQPDAFGIDLAVRQRVIPVCRFLFERYWRVEVSGEANIPETGPALLVSNHSGALPFDGAMILTAAQLKRDRVVRFLYDRFVERLQPVSAFYRKVGGAVASRENALGLLAAGECVLIFPEGVSGVAKDFGDRYHLRPFSPGFARMALALDVPVIPVAVVGAEEIYPLVGRAEGVGKAFGMPYVPITPFFPLLGMLGTLPLPTKWFIRFGKAVRMKQVDPEARWLQARKEARKMHHNIQKMVLRLKAKRQSIFFG